jgi:uncharacterized protein (DUF4415 family)
LLKRRAALCASQRPIKAQISFRVDADVLAWLKSKGEGHLSRINTILRERTMAEGKRGG